jgi:hypothetical protein
MAAGAMPKGSSPSSLLLPSVLLLRPSPFCPARCVEIRWRWARSVGILHRRARSVKLLQRRWEVAEAGGSCWTPSRSLTLPSSLQMRPSLPPGSRHPPPWGRSSIRFVSMLMFLASCYVVMACGTIITDRIGRGSTRLKQILCSSAFIQANDWTSSAMYNPCKILRDNPCICTSSASAFIYLQLISVMDVVWQ